MKPSLILPTSGSPIQLFGANPQFYADPKYGGIKGHNGIDFLTNHGWTIYASHDGVAEYQIDPSGGHGVVITSKDGSFKSLYWHLTDGTEPQFKSPLFNKKNIPVETGDIIGYSDNTGASTGDHLHWGMKFMKNGETINKDNGFLGAVDPMLYCNGYTPEQFLKLKQKAYLLQQLVNLWIKLKTLTKKGV
jgi:murein DD-endopeptidase MepM/ murein hydrolase activator NlpD